MEEGGDGGDKVTGNFVYNKNVRSLFSRMV